MPSTSNVIPISQLTSRGLRYAPVKNTRSMCAKIATMNMLAAQWWICLISSPPRMSNEMFSVDAYACDIEMPSSLAYEPWYTTSCADGTKKNARYVPVSSRITKDHSAISPSMNVQWSGKTFRIRTRTPRAPWNLSSSHPPTPSSAFGTCTSWLTANFTLLRRRRPHGRRAPWVGSPMTDLAHRRARRWASLLLVAAQRVTQAEEGGRPVTDEDPPPVGPVGPCLFSRQGRPPGQGRQGDAGEPGDVGVLRPQSGLV